MKEIPYFPGYFITEDGDVWSLVKCARKGRWLTPHPGTRGYLRVPVRHPVLGKMGMYVHRLVAITYIPNPLGLPEINHLDGVNTHNHYLNLEWATNASNCEHKARMGLAPWGEEHFKAKLTGEEVRDIRRLIAAGHAQTAIALLYDVHPTTVNGIKAGRTWKHLDG